MDACNQEYFCCKTKLRKHDGVQSVIEIISSVRMSGLLLTTAAEARELWVFDVASVSLMR